MPSIAAGEHSFAQRLRDAPEAKLRLAEAAFALLEPGVTVFLDATTGELVGSTAAEQARRCLENLQAVCAAAETSLASAVRMTIYMTDLEAFATVNEVYGSFFVESPPARVTVGVAELPKGAQVEIDAIVAL